MFRIFLLWLALQSTQSLIIDQTRVLNRINDIRDIHRAKPLATSIQLSDSAQAWASSLSSSHLLSKRDGQIIGLAKIPVSFNDVTPYVLSTIDKWYAQNALYDVNMAACVPTMSCDFTQLVWKASTSIGIGFDSWDQDTIVIVIDFSPKGNVPNTFYNNVSPAPNPTPSAPIAQTSTYVNSLVGIVNVQVMFHNSGAYNTVKAIRLRNILAQFTSDPTQTVQFQRRLPTPNYSYNVWYLVGPFSSTNIAQQFVASINMQKIIADTGIAVLYIYPAIISSNDPITINPTMPRKILSPTLPPPQLPINKCVQ